MRMIDADELCEGRVCNDPVRIAALCAPTVDAVKVVRCRNCFYCKQDLENPARCVHPAFTWAPKVCLDDYCSRGELWGGCSQ